MHDQMIGAYRLNVLIMEENEKKILLKTISFIKTRRSAVSLFECEPFSQSNDFFPQT